MYSLLSLNKRQAWIPSRNQTKWQKYTFDLNTKYITDFAEELKEWVEKGSDVNDQQMIDSLLNVHLPPQPST